jgi:hypothetical protein
MCEVTYRTLIIRTMTSDGIEDPSEHVNNWQIVSLLLLSLYTSLLELLTKLSERTRDSVVRVVLSSYWGVVQMISESIKTRSALFRIGPGSQIFLRYLFEFNLLLYRGRVASASLVSNAEVQDLRSRSFTDLLQALRLLQAECLNDGRSPIQKAFSTERSTSLVSPRGESSQTLDFSQDDFMDGPVSLSERSQTLTSETSSVLEGLVNIPTSDIRINFTDYHLHLLCFLISTAISTLPLNHSVQVIIDSLTTTENEERRIHLSSELGLYFGEKMSTVSCLTDIYEFFLYNSWEKDWGSLGYYKVLCIIYQFCTHSNHDYFKNEMTRTAGSGSGSAATGAGGEGGGGGGYCSIHDIAELLIFSSEAKISKYLTEFWRCRYMRLKCGAEYFISFPVRYKIPFGELLLNSLVDSDLRVRQEGQSLLPLLFQYIPTNHVQIYQDMKIWIGFDEIVQESIERLQANSTLTLSLNRMEPIVQALLPAGCSSLHLLPLVLSDLLILSSLLSSNHASFEGYVTMLTRLSHAQKYPSLSCALVDFIETIILKWLETFLTIDGCHLSQFPFALLQYSSLPDFFLDFSSVLLPHFCLIQPSDNRWKVITYFADICGYGSQDSGIARMIYQNIIPIFARLAAWKCPISLFPHSTNPSNEETKSSHSSIHRKKSELIRTFLSRVINENEVQRLIETHLTDYLLSILLIPLMSEQLFEVSFTDLTELAGLTDTEVRSDDWHRNIYSPYMDHLLTQICKHCKISSHQSLIIQTNLIFIFAELQTHLRETSHPMIQFCLVSGICYLVNQLVHDTQRRGGGGGLTTLAVDGGVVFMLRVILNSLLTCCEISHHSPLQIVLKTIASLSQFLFSLSHTILSSSHLLMEFFSELFWLYCTFRSLKQTQERDNPHELTDLSSSSPLAQTQTHRSYFQDRYQALLSSSSLSAKDLDFILNQLSEILFQFSQRSQLEQQQDPFFSMILPLPQSLSVYVKRDKNLVHLTQLDPQTSSSLNGNFVLKMKQFTELMNKHLMGEILTKGWVWLFVNGLTEMLRSFSTLGSSSGSGLGSGSYKLQQEELPILSSFLSSLLSFCKKEYNSNPSSPLLREISYIISSLGLIDFHSLDHTNLSHRWQGAHQYVPSIVKLSIICSTLQLIWEGSVQESRAAMKCLRNLQIIKLFPESYRFDETTPPFYLMIVQLVLKRPLCVKVLSEFSEVNHSWEMEVWTTTETNYKTWITQLVSSLIMDSYCRVGALSKKQVNSKGQIPGSDIFFPALIDLTQVSSNVSESIFPLLILDLITTSSQVAVEKIEERFQSHLFHQSSNLVEAIRLGCHTLVFLFRQQVHRFVTSSNRRKKNTEGGSGGSGVSQSSQRESGMGIGMGPYSYILNINHELVVEASLRCNSVCSAALLLELHLDLTKGESLSSTTAGLLFQISQNLHDPDSIFGVAQGSDLLSQAILYSQTGQWGDALATFECLTQSPLSSTTQEQIDTGISTSLRALGYQHLLQQFTDSSSKIDEDNESCWRNEMLRLSSRGMSVAVSLNQWGTLPAPVTSHHPSPSGDFYNGNIAAALRDISNNKRSQVVKRMESCSRDMFPSLLDLFTEESSKNLLKCMAKLEKLIEISDCVTNFDSDSHSFVNSILSIWRDRLQLMTNDSVTTESVLTLRLALLMGLFNSKISEESHFLQFFDQIHDATRSKMNAHSLSPLVYQIQQYFMTPPVGANASSSSSSSSALLTSSSSSISSSSRTRTLTSLGRVSDSMRARYEMNECKLLWNKGLQSLAIQKMNQIVLPSLHRILEKKSRKHHSNSETSTRGAAAGGAAGAGGEVCDLYSEALRQCGEWIFTKKAANGSLILSKYLKPSLENSQSVSQQMEVYRSLGRFHFFLYSTVKYRIESEEWKQAKRVIIERQNEFDRCNEHIKLRYKHLPKATYEKDPEYRTIVKYIFGLKKELQMDYTERQAVEESLSQHLLDAMSCYQEFLCLSTTATATAGEGTATAAATTTAESMSSSDVDIVFHLVHLWLDNHTSGPVNNLFYRFINRVPSYKFLSLTYQLMSRLEGMPSPIGTPSGSSSSHAPPLTRHQLQLQQQGQGQQQGQESGDKSFQMTLSNLLFYLCRDHPYHTLPQLFALCNERGVTTDSTSTEEGGVSPRIIAARHILQRLQLEFQSSTQYNQLIEQMTTFLQLTIDLASIKMDDFVKKHKTKGIRFTDILKKTGAGVPYHLCFGGNSKGASSSIPVLTKSQTVHPDGDYRDVVFIARIEETFSLTDAGISRPKIIKCHGTDGMVYMQLIKGGDDTRQDAVMQQVFEHVNVMLRGDKECSYRKLHIRTYKIIPLTPQTGIIEWVENTIPFGSYLCDSKDVGGSLGAHTRYYPNDLTHSQARVKLENANNNNKEEVFQEICRDLHPAFHYFFIEMYSNPMEWLTNRLIYTRTVSVNSMIGYILGIGDRHSHNILIDYKTAEIVHIDFGIMFEQGKALGTPETVPFRLTRDLVDGMGVNGIEGTYRKCCEIVLRLLRQNMNQLITILEVVIHDPLYKWCLSPLQARNKQQMNNEITGTTTAAAAPTPGPAAAAGGGSSSGTDAAKRALLRIKGKLQGQEESSGETLSVEGQVEYLINEARDYKNLCKLFPGWAPWL